MELAYEHVPLAPWKSADDRARLAAINPNARVPVLEDDGFVVWESMAINLYLGDRHGGPLWPNHARERAIVQASIALTRDPAKFTAEQLKPLRAAGLSSLEILDLIHAIAIFAWANRLMQNLGESVGG